MLGASLVRVADHAKHALALGDTVNGELGVEDFVAAVLAVGLSKHHQLHIGRVALQLREGLHQVINFVRCQSQAKLGVGYFQRCFAALQHIDMGHGGGL